MTSYNEFDLVMLGLAAWREARGESLEGMRGVMHTIVNKATKHGISVGDQVTSHLYISSVTWVKDPQLTLYPKSTDPVWDLARRVISGQDKDPTGGATNYFNPSLAKPDWAAKLVKTATIGRHDFFKEV